MSTVDPERRGIGQLTESFEQATGRGLARRRLR